MQHMVTLTRLTRMLLSLWELFLVLHYITAAAQVAATSKQNTACKNEKNVHPV